MSSGIGVHFVGGPLHGQSMWVRPLEVDRFYRLYPTIFPKEAYGIPSEWEMSRLGYVDVVSFQEWRVDLLDQIVLHGRQKIARVSQEYGSMLLPLTVRSEVEEIELVEGLQVKAVRLSALAALPS